MEQAVSDVELAFRLLVAGFVVVAPTALFVAFYRLLVRMRDDDLVNQVLDRTQEVRSRQADPATVLTGGVLRGGTGGERTRDCPSCGASNPAFASYCGVCLDELE
jgi:hypothetical protein